jgi:hypothetical protein
MLVLESLRYEGAHLLVLAIMLVPTDYIPAVPVWKGYSCTTSFADNPVGTWGDGRHSGIIRMDEKVFGL